MKAPISWLQDFVKIDIPAEALADKLVHAGFEVEEIIREADAIKNVVTGRVLAMERHPNSDHLWICQINVKTATLQIVTGAQNVQVGDIVPVALDGAVLPDGKRIFNGELRGVKSLGMLCGGSELGLTDADYEGADVDGILILKPDTKVGVDINEILGRTDVILDVSVTANRPDCNSIWGIAREVGAVLHKTVKAPVTSYTATPERIFNLLDVQVADADLCPRYMAKAVKNIKICESPKIIKDRLRAVGIKPINNIVDITNYILIELGQPMHAFDYEKSQVIALSSVARKKAKLSPRSTTRRITSTTTSLSSPTPKNLWLSRALWAVLTAAFPTILTPLSLKARNSHAITYVALQENLTLKATAAQDLKKASTF